MRFGHVDAQIAGYGCRTGEGDLTFTLDGYKLKGSRVLVRTRGYARADQKSAGPSWLLIKRKDE